MFVPSVTGPVGWKNYRHNWIFHLSRIQRGLRKSCAALRRIARYTPVLKHLLFDINELAVKRSKYKTKKRGSWGGGHCFIILRHFSSPMLRFKWHKCHAARGRQTRKTAEVDDRFVYFVEEMPFFLFWPASVVNILNVSNAAGWCHCLEKVEKNLRPPNVPSHGAGGPWFLSFSRIHMQMSFIRPSADDFASCQLCTKRPLYLINSRNSINTSSI